MANGNYFDHTSPTYGSPFDMVNTLGIAFTAADENIAKGHRTVEEVMEGRMNSEDHRANTLNPDIIEIGISYENNERN